MAKKSTRGAQGRGSVYKRASDGKWVAVVDLGVIDGKRRRKPLYGDTQDEVIRKLDAARQMVREGKPLANERKTVAQWFDHWFSVTLPARVTDGKVRATTADGYRYMVDRYVLPTIGRKAIARLTVSDIESLLASLAMPADGRRDLGSSSRKQVRAILGKSMRDARRLGWIAVNPVTDTDVPPKVHRVSDALNVEQADALLAAAKGDRLEALVSVGLMLGLRKGEALALRWTDVDLDAGMLTIAGTLKRRVGVKKGVAGAGLVINPPKTESGRRTIKAPAPVLASLREHRARQIRARMKAGAAWVETGHVFTTRTGARLDPSYMTRLYVRLTTRAGLGAVRYHALRHSAAQLQLAAGVPLWEISKTLGHAGIAITNDLYGRVAPEILSQGAAAMDRLFGGTVDAADTVCRSGEAR